MMADVCAVADAEVEDLFPIEYLAYVATRILRGPEEEFSDFVQSGIAFVSQIEAYAKSIFCDWMMVGKLKLLNVRKNDYSNAPHSWIHIVNL